MNFLLFSTVKMCAFIFPVHPCVVDLVYINPLYYINVINNPSKIDINPNQIFVRPKGLIIPQINITATFSIIINIIY